MKKNRPEGRAFWCATIYS